MRDAVTHSNQLRFKRDLLYSRLKEAIVDLSVNGKYEDEQTDLQRRLPNTLSVNFPGVVGAELLAATPSVCASTGAACHSGETKMSDTLQGIGLLPEVAKGTVRLSVGRLTTTEEIEQGANDLLTTWKSMTV
tara:strand:- start:434 stop:829 length:396 start_codon:yes stop_codon:yes gene_type:complete